MWGRELGGGLRDVAAHYGTEDGTHEGGVGEDGEGVYALEGVPEVGDGAAGAGEWGGAEEAGEEAEDELRLDVCGEGRGHDEDHVEAEGNDVDGVAADCFRDGACEEGTAAEADEEQTGR